MADELVEPIEPVEVEPEETTEVESEVPETDTRADDLARRLHTELVRATGKLQDPSDLLFDAAHLDDADKLSADIDALLTAKPHLKRRKITGDAGQGQQCVKASGPQDFSGFLRS
jgi:hypothetical protein